MWKKFFCWAIGHKVMVKAFTGNSIVGTGTLTGQEEKMLMYKWQREPYCLRCGQPTTALSASYAHDDLVELGALANWEVMGEWERRQKAAGILRRIGFGTMVHEYQQKETH